MDHHVLTVGGFRDKVEAVVALVEANPRAIVFTRTREGAMELRDALGQAGITAVDLHGNLTQKVRERNLERFSTGRADAVVATDVAARGIHVDNVGMVIHFDPPSDAKAYLHRSGRTARAGESGAVVTIATPRQLDTIVAQQRDAGVTSRYHDIRTTPRPMHALVLAESGTTEAPARSSRGARPQGDRPYRSGHGHHAALVAAATRAPRPAARRPSASRPAPAVPAVAPPVAPPGAPAQRQEGPLDRFRQGGARHPPLIVWVRAHAWPERVMRGDARGEVSWGCRMHAATHEEGT